MAVSMSAWTKKDISIIDNISYVIVLKKYGVVTVIELFPKVTE